VAYRLCLRSAILLAALAGAAGTPSLCVAGPLSSGDRSSAKSQNDPRNFDWTRPLPDEIAPNPTHAPGPRPYLRDVGTQNPDDRAIVEPSARSMWARPKPEEVSPNPTTPWGTRPYLRSVGPGTAQNQGNVRHYSSLPYSGPKQQTPAVVAGGGSGPTGPGKENRAQPWSATAADQKDPIRDAGSNTKKQGSGPEGAKDAASNKRGGEPKHPGEPKRDPTQSKAADPSKSGAEPKQAGEPKAAASPAKGAGPSQTAPNESSAKGPAADQKQNAGASGTNKGDQPAGAKLGEPKGGSPPGSPKATAERPPEKVAANSPLAPAPTAAEGDRPGGGGTIADISALVREYLSTGAQSRDFQVSGGLSRALASLLAKTDLAPKKVEQSLLTTPPGPPSAAGSPNPANTVVVGSVPGRLEFSGLSASVRGNFR
jgi:flagellar protein FliO/FliZ